MLLVGFELEPEEGERKAMNEFFLISMIVMKEWYNGHKIGGKEITKDSFEDLQQHICVLNLDSEFGMNMTPEVMLIVLVLLMMTTTTMMLMMMVMMMIVICTLMGLLSGIFALVRRMLEKVRGRRACGQPGPSYI